MFPGILICPDSRLCVVHQAWSEGFQFRKAAPFFSPQEPHDVILIRTAPATANKVEAADIEVVLPCTPLRKGLLV